MHGPSAGRTAWMSDDELPVLLTVEEAATLCKTGPSAIRVRVHRGQLRPVAKTGRGHLLFALADVMNAAPNRRMRDKGAHAV